MKQYHRCTYRPVPPIAPLRSTSERPSAQVLHLLQLPTALRGWPVVAAVNHVHIFKQLFAMDPSESLHLSN